MDSNNGDDSDDSDISPMTVMLTSNCIKTSKCKIIGGVIIAIAHIHIPDVHCVLVVVTLIVCLWFLLLLCPREGGSDNGP